MSVVKANPSKSFFVDMITRDIELDAAILDLIDNCIDGVSRVIQNHQVDDYTGFYARLDLTSDSFKLSDNCGGIERRNAENYAFRLGRDPNYNEDNDRQTIGMYGIGMKRALFKIGNQSEVITKCNQDAYKVTIPEGWADIESWEFPITECNDLTENGTTILSNNLTSSAKANFESSLFIDELKTEIQKHFSYILHKGFVVFLNGEKIEPLSVSFLVKEVAGVEPFVYKGNIDNVDITIVCGFITSPIKNSEEENEIATGNRSELAGWTIICNDRVVVYKDKTRLTGWGENPVPQYHTQFINISGVVRFTSNDAYRLPLTTTKRGIDNNSELYMYIRGVMKEATKTFTDVTNKIKADYEANKAALFNSTISMTEKDVIDEYSVKAKSIIERKKFSSSTNESKYKPSVKVISPRSETVTVRFQKLKSELSLVADYLNIDPEQYSKTAEKAFEQVLLEAKKMGG